MNEEILHFGNVLCFTVCPDKKVNHPLKREKTRFVVLSRETQTEGYPVTYLLKFYNDELKYREHSLCHKEQLEEKLFCGLINGTKNSRNEDCYIALIFETFTIIMTLQDCDHKKVQSTVQSCKNIFEDIFGSYKSCVVKFESFPQNEKKVFDKESSGHVLLSVTKHRISICSKRFFHVCLYTWQQSDVRIEFSPSKIIMDVSGQVSHPGTYIFHSENCMVLKEHISQIFCTNVYTPVASSPVPWSYIPNRKNAKSSSSSCSLPHSKELSTASSKHCTSSTSSGSVFENDLPVDDLYLTPECWADCDEDEFFLDLNDYVLKNKEPLKAAFRRVPGRVLTMSNPSETENADGASLSSLIFSKSSQEYLDAFYDVCERFFFWLKARSPGRDTLEMSWQTRFRFCNRLYIESCSRDGKEDWEVLAAVIGLCDSAIDLVRMAVKKSFIPYPAAEVVLRHWQFMYNRYGAKSSPSKCPVPCTKEGLLNILEKMKRSDLIELIRQDDNH